MLFKFFVFILALFVLFIRPNESAIYFVKSNSNSTASNGSNWEYAFKNLYDALNVAEAFDLIFVSGGIYYPTNGTERNATFRLNNTILIGGFNGTELYNTSASVSDLINSRPNPLIDTILDGDIGVKNNNSDNVYHVVTVDDNVVLDGFIIRNGNADGEYFNGYGGGIFHYDTDSTNSSSSLGNEFSNVIILNNTAYQGGGFYSFGSRETRFYNSSFISNNASEGLYNGGTGGAIHASYDSNINVYSSLFDSNQAYYKGGAIYSDYGSDIYIEDTLFLNNEVLNKNSLGGAIFSEDRDSLFGSTNSILINCNFTQNKASSYGGAICWYNGITANTSNNVFNSNIAQYGEDIAVYDSEDIDMEDLKALNLFGLINSTTNNSTLGSNATTSFSNNSIVVISTEEITNYTSGYPKEAFILYLWDNAYIEDMDNNTVPFIIYCDSNQTENDNKTLNGSSWETALIYLQDCIDTAHSFNDSNIEIWVKGGIYYPTIIPDNISDDNGYSIQLYPNIKLYGGFKGNESDRNDRNLSQYPSYIIGNYNNTQSANIFIGADNVLIDGFIIQNGYAVGVSENDTIITPTTTSSVFSLQNARRLLQVNSTQFNNTMNNTEVNNTDLSRLYSGGGIYLNKIDNMQINNVLFYNNFAESGGAISCINNSSLIMESCVFVSNGAILNGGSINSDNCDITCNGCLFVGNTASYKGGSIYLGNNSDGNFSDCLWDSNNALEAGGAIAIDNGGELYINDSEIENNTATFAGGGIYAGGHNVQNIQTVNLSNNVTFIDNYSPYHNDDIYLWNDVILNVIENNNVSSNASNISDCNWMLDGDSTMVALDICVTNYNASEGFKSYMFKCNANQTAVEKWEFIGQSCSSNNYTIVKNYTALDNYTFECNNNQNNNQCNNYLIQRIYYSNDQNCSDEILKPSGYYSIPIHISCMQDPDDPTTSFMWSCPDASMGFMNESGLYYFNSSNNTCDSNSFLGFVSLKQCSNNSNTYSEIVNCNGVAYINGYELPSEVGPGVNVSNNYTNLTTMPPITTAFNMTSTGFNMTSTEFNMTSTEFNMTSTEFNMTSSSTTLNQTNFNATVSSTPSPSSSTTGSTTTSSPTSTTKNSGIRYEYYYTSFIICLGLLSIL